MTCEQAREIMAGGWLRENTGAETEALRLHLETCLECSADTVALSGIWEQLAAIPVPEPGKAMQTRWRAAIQSLEAPSREPSQRYSRFAHFWPRNPVWQVSIAAACLIAGLIAGTNIPHRDSEIARLQDEVASTREMVALSLLQQQSATERIRGVNYADRLHTMEPEVLSALTDAVAYDPSVNVRLSAIDALSKASGNEAVVGSLTQSLTRQESPLVQAALIDYLIDARDHRAVGTLRQFAAQPDINPEVLERARFALRQLSR